MTLFLPQTCYQLYNRSFSLRKTYSCLRDIIGSWLAALFVGVIPNISPIVAATPKDSKMDKPPNYSFCPVPAERSPA